MAQPRPIVRVHGALHSSEVFDLKANPDTGEVRQGCRGQVLTDGGGFLEVYFGPDAWPALPDRGGRVDLEVEIDVWQRPYSDGSGRKYAQLMATYLTGLAKAEPAAQVAA